MAHSVERVPTEARTRRRFDTLTQAREPVATRTVSGQLPTFERSYLETELKTIGVITGALLGLIVVLTVLLR